MMTQVVYHQANFQWMAKDTVATSEKCRNALIRHQEDRPPGALGQWADCPLCLHPCGLLVTCAHWSLVPWQLCIPGPRGALSPAR